MNNNMDIFDIIYEQNEKKDHKWIKFKDQMPDSSKPIWVFEKRIDKDYLCFHLDSHEFMQDYVKNCYWQYADMPKPPID